MIKYEIISDSEIDELHKEEEIEYRLPFIEFDEEEGDVVICAKDGLKVLGFLRYKTLPSYTTEDNVTFNDVAVFKGIGIDKKYKGQGIGKTLIDLFFKKIKAKALLLTPYSKEGKKLIKHLIDDKADKLNIKIIPEIY